MGGNSENIDDGTNGCCLCHRYLIRVQGHLDATWSEWFGGMSISTEVAESGPETVIEGVVADQAQLHGILTKLVSLNLSLILVKRLPAITSG